MCTNAFNVWRRLVGKVQVLYSKRNLSDWHSDIICHVRWPRTLMVKSLAARMTCWHSWTFALCSTTSTVQFLPNLVRSSHQMIDDVIEYTRSPTFDEVLQFAYASTSSTHVEHNWRSAKLVLWNSFCNSPVTLTQCIAWWIGSRTPQYTTFIYLKHFSLV